MKSILMIKRVNSLLTALYWLFIVFFILMISAYAFSSSGIFIGTPQKVELPYQLSHDEVDDLIESGAPLTSSRGYFLKDGKKIEIDQRTSDGLPVKSRYYINNKVLVGPFTWQGLLSLFWTCLYFILMIYGLILLKRILKNTLQQNPFVGENALFLKRIGYLVFVYLLASWIYNNVIKELIRMSLDESRHFSFSIGLDTGTISILLIGCLLLILASIFEYGAEMKQEVDLTI